jgi:ABC-type nickel/cobalt efflux system permease component RcnA
MGAAGGLVPSPSALVVLLASVALGRTAFGVLLVLAYGLGMAGTLTVAGLSLIRLEARLSRQASARWAAVARVVPAVTAVLVLLVGLFLAVRGVAA